MASVKWSSNGDTTIYGQIPYLFFHTSLREQLSAKGLQVVSFFLQQNINWMTWRRKVNLKSTAIYVDVYVVIKYIPELQIM